MSLSKRGDFGPDGLVRAWNQAAGLAGLRHCLKLAGVRLAAAKRRLEEQPDPAYWAGVIERIAESKFCRGENANGWVADIDFLLRPATHVKALEGKYDNREVPPTKKELEAAAKWRTAVWMKCRHDPKCEDYAACLRRIALALRGED